MKFLLKHLLLSVSILVLCLVLAFASAYWMAPKKPEKGFHQELSLARLVSRYSTYVPPEEVIKHLLDPQENHIDPDFPQLDKNFGPPFAVYNSMGESLSGSTGSIDPSLLPTAVLSPVILPPSAPGLEPRTAIRLESKEARFLIIDTANMEKKEKGGFLILLLIVVVAALVAAFLSSTVLARYLRGKAALASDVFARIKKGETGARFQISPRDKSAELMVLFNQAADEMERLSDKVRETEQGRIRKLQELSHDLRTPVGSLRMLMDTLHLHFEKLSPQQMKDIISQGAREAGYLAELIDDLMFLAIIETPDALALDEEVDLAKILSNEVSALRIRLGTNGIQLDLASDQSCVLVRSNPQILRRLVRNVLENAVSFSRKKLRAHLSCDPNQGRATLEVIDDGPGFPPEVLANFGKTRFLTGSNQPEKRVSLGLGSVIIRSLVDAHGGELKLWNVNGSATNGAALSFSISLSNEIPNKIAA